MHDSRMQLNHQYVFRFALQFFPVMVDIVLGILPNQDNTRTFNSLLRDMCLVWLRWKMLFERNSAGALVHMPEILQPAKSLMTHLFLVGYHSSSDVVRLNCDYIRVFTAQWRTAVPLPGRIVRGIVAHASIAS